MERFLLKFHLVAGGLLAFIVAASFISLGYSFYRRISFCSQAIAFDEVTRIAIRQICDFQGFFGNFIILIVGSWFLWALWWWFFGGLVMAEVIKKRLVK